MQDLTIFRNGALSSGMFRSNLQLPDSVFNDSLSVTQDGDAVRFYVKDGVLYTYEDEESRANFQLSGIKWNPRYLVKLNDGTIQLLAEITNQELEIKSSVMISNSQVRSRSNIPEESAMMLARPASVAKMTTHGDSDPVNVDTDFVSELGVIKLESKARNVIPVESKKIGISQIYQVTLVPGTWQSAINALDISKITYPSGPVTVFNGELPEMTGNLDAVNNRIYLSKTDLLQVLADMESTESIQEHQDEKYKQKDVVLFIEINSKLQDTSVPLELRLPLKGQNLISYNIGEIKEGNWVITLDNSVSHKFSVDLVFSLPIYH